MEQQPALMTPPQNGPEPPAVPEETIASRIDARVQEARNRIDESVEGTLQLKMRLMEAARESCSVWHLYMVPRYGGHRIDLVLAGTVAMTDEWFGEHVDEVIGWPLTDRIHKGSSYFRRASYAA